MSLMRSVTTACCLSLAAAVFAPNVLGDEWNRRTVVTFSAPVEIPGVHLAGWGVLPAGTYVFKILDSQSNRHIVQIFNKDETIVYATILAIPNYRLRATDKTVITFRERPAGQPEALRAWFYPGRNFGEEFVYPKAKALELAKATNLPVLFTPVEMPVEVAAQVKSADEPVVTEMKQAPIMAVKPSGEEVQLAEVVTPPPALATEAQQSREPAQAQQSREPAQEEISPRTLPQTASPLPLIGLLGFLALAAGAGIRFIEKRV